MAGNNKLKTKNGSSKKKQPPTMSVRKNVPRTKLSFDGTVLHGTEFTRNLVTVANGASMLLFVDCTNLDTVVANKFQQSIALDLAAIAGRYTEYRYTSVQLHWIPHVSPGVADAGSPITVGYVDNPELITNVSSALVTADIAAVKGMRNLKSFNAWQGFTYNVPLTRRLPWFNVNTNMVYVVDTIERATQGLVLAVGESLSAAIDLGAFHITYSVELRGLQTVLTT